MMISGPDFIFIFQSGFIVLALIVISHIIFEQELEVQTFVLFLMGLLAVQITNTVELLLFERFIFEEFSAVVIIGPIIEEVVKFVFLFYLAQISEIEKKQLLFSAVMIGLGFGSGELVGYASTYGTDILFQRSIYLIFGHPLFAVTIAFGWYFYNIADKYNSIGLIISLFIAIILHVIWNVISVISAQFLPIVMVFYGLLWFLIILETYAEYLITGSVRDSS